MPLHQSLLLAATLLLASRSAHGFTVPLGRSNVDTRLTPRVTRLCSSPERKPRRSLEKRPRKRDRKASPFTNIGTIGGIGNSNSIAKENDDAFWETAERRSLISWTAREAGEDYWYDVEEFQKVQQREAAIRAREPGQISNQKLWVEVLSPYKQNWIGLISVSIIALAFIFKNFPEVIDPPIIPNIPANL